MGTEDVGHSQDLLKALRDWALLASLLHAQEQVV